MQRLLRTADWNADAVHDELRSFVVERLGPGEVLILAGARSPVAPGIGRCVSCAPRTGGR
jgi:hypothetical protein